MFEEWNQNYVFLTTGHHEHIPNPPKSNQREKGKMVTEIWRIGVRPVATRWLVRSATVRSAAMREEAGDQRERTKWERENRFVRKSNKKNRKFFLAFHLYRFKFGTILFTHVKIFNI